jgi:hypothetical protein
MPAVYCKNCGAQIHPGQVYCWQCHTEREWLPDEPPPPLPQARFQFGLSTILLVVTVTAILCSITKMRPGLGIPLAIFSLPALVRTCLVVRRWDARGQPMSTGHKASVFVVTVFTIAAAVVAGILVFYIVVFVTCLAGGPSFPYVASPAAPVVAGIAGIATAIFVSWILWKSFPLDR